MHTLNPAVPATCHAEGAPLPEVEAAPRPAVVTTFRVVIRETGAVLRTGFESLPRYGRPEHFTDQLAEFPNDDFAFEALNYVRSIDPASARVSLAVVPVEHAALTRFQLPSLFVRLRETAYELAVARMALTEPEHRAAAGLRTSGGNR